MCVSKIFARRPCPPQWIGSSVWPLRFDQESDLDASGFLARAQRFSLQLRKQHESDENETAPLWRGCFCNYALSILTTGGGRLVVCGTTTRGLRRPRRL